MIDIKRYLDEQMILESRKQKRIFNNDSMTFKQLKDAFNDVFGTNIVSVSRRVPIVSFYMTNKDGNWYCAAVDRPSKILKVNAFPKSMKLAESSQSSANNTIQSIAEALATLDDVLVNRFFANGKNMVKCSLICPPEGCEGQYNDRCFLNIDGVDCFNKNCKCTGSDQKAAAEIANILKSNDALCQEFNVASIDSLQPLKNCKSEKKILKAIINKLQELVDGIGWNSTIRDYVQDRYSREIVNKALQHGIDMSKNSSFVNELVSRLSGMSSLCPTKSDLVAFAKRDGVDCKSDKYKTFLEDLEAEANATSDSILSPIEKIVWYAIQNALVNAIGYIKLDQNPKAQKLLKQLPKDAICSISNIDNCDISIEKIEAAKKAIDKLCQAYDCTSPEIRIVVSGKPYSLKNDIARLQKLQEVIR